MTSQRDVINILLSTPVIIRTPGLLMPIKPFVLDEPLDFRLLLPMTRTEYVWTPLCTVHDVGFAEMTAECRRSVSALVAKLIRDNR